MSQHNLVVIIGLAILNGIFSPALIVVFALHPVWYPAIFPVLLPLMFLLSSLIVATLTLMLGGVPAALYERFAGGKQSTAAGYIWLACVILLTMPAVPAIVKALGL